MIELRWFMFAQIMSAPPPRRSKASREDGMEVEPTVLAEPDESSADSLVSSNDPDDMANEQTWPTEEELSGAPNAGTGEGIPDAMAGTTPKRVRKIPKGMSEYQAAWILDVDDEEEEGGEGEEGHEGEQEGDEEMQEVEEEEEEMVELPDQEMETESKRSVAFQDLDVEEEDRQYVLRLTTSYLPLPVVQAADMAFTKPRAGGQRRPRFP